MAGEPPKRLTLDIHPQNRDTSTAKDSRLVNAYAERQSDGVVRLFKRPGLTEYDDIGGNGLGVYNWNSVIYSVNGTTLYKDGVSLGTVDATNGVYRFDQVMGATPKLLLGNGVSAYFTDGTTLTEITDGDFPAAFQKGWAYINGTSYVMTSRAAIQGDEINDPSDWDSLNVIIAQIEPDLGMALSKQLVYAIALKQWSTEAFYDAGNATGSPLGRVEGAKISFGCAHQDSPRVLDDMLFWASATRFSTWQVAMMKNMKADIVSTDPIERLLTAGAATVYSWVGQLNGHKFYVLTLVGLNLTLVYDATEKRWTQWTDTNGNYMPFVDSTTSPTGFPLLQHATNGKLYVFNPEAKTDAGDLITVDVVTPNFDGGTRVMKELERMTFIAEQVKGSALNVRWNDSDYDPAKWTNFRDVDLGQEFPILQNCGSFRRRAFNFRHRANTSWWMEAADLSLALGTV